MNTRRDFFRRLFLATGAIAVAPAVIIRPTWPPRESATIEYCCNAIGIRAQLRLCQEWQETSRIAHCYTPEYLKAIEALVKRRRHEQAFLQSLFYGKSI